MARRDMWLAASIVAAVMFYLLRHTGLPSGVFIALKGLPVALLAMFALRAGVSRMAAIMALGALGDVLIEWRLEAGAIAFFAGHLVAMALYLAYRRGAPAMLHKAVASALLILTPAAAFALSGPQAALYALALGGMAACAWMSAFSRWQVGLGAVLFVASDLLIFARLGPLSDSTVPDMLIWPLYYAGQWLICTGVVVQLGRPKMNVVP